jgi:hypothetical protein
MGIATVFIALAIVLSAGVLAMTVLSSRERTQEQPEREVSRGTSRTGRSA